MNKFAAKLTPEQRQELVRRFEAGESKSALAKEYGIHPRTADKMVFGGQRRYKDLQGPVPRARTGQELLMPVGGSGHSTSTATPRTPGRTQAQPLVGAAAAAETLENMPLDRFRDTLEKSSPDKIIDMAHGVPVSWFGWPSNLERDKASMYITALKEALSTRRMTIADLINAWQKWTKT